MKNMIVCPTNVGVIMKNDARQDAKKLADALRQAYEAEMRREEIEQDTVDIYKEAYFKKNDHGLHILWRGKG